MEETKEIKEPVRGGYVRFTRDIYADQVGMMAEHKKKTGMNDTDIIRKGIDLVCSKKQTKTQLRAMIENLRYKSDKSSFNVGWNSAIDEVLNLL